MAFTEDLSLFFDQDEFAVAAVIKRGSAVIRTINVILTTPTQEVAVFDAAAEMNVPFVQCRTSDLDDVKHGDTMTISAQVYRITERADDGTGISTVQLKK